MDTLNGPVTCDVCGIRFASAPSGVLDAQAERFIAFNSGWRWDLVKDIDGEVIGERIQCVACRPKPVHKDEGHDHHESVWDTKAAV